MPMTRPPLAQEPVVATMCMQHRRWPKSLKTVESLEGQVNTLYLCLNDFWEIPPELKRDWIKVLHLGANLGDAARFYLLRNAGPLDAHVLSCDDDLIYPKSYVRDFLIALPEHPDALLTHHGYVAQYPDEGDFKYDKVMRFRHEEKHSKPLTVPGSGVSFIPKSIFNQLEFTSQVRLNQADIHLACNCLKLGVRVTGLAHAKGYFKEIGDQTGLYHSVTNRPDWMSKVYEIYRSYGLSLTQPPEAKP